MEYPIESNEEFSKRMDFMREEARERFWEMAPEQQEALKKARRHHVRKATDEAETSFVIGIRKKLETNPEEVTPEEYRVYLAILERDTERERQKNDSEANK